MERIAQVPAQRLVDAVVLGAAVGRLAAFAEKTIVVITEKRPHCPVWEVVASDLAAVPWNDGIQGMRSSAKMRSRYFVLRAAREQKDKE